MSHWEQLTLFDLPPTSPPKPVYQDIVIGSCPNCGCDITGPVVDLDYPPVRLDHVHWQSVPGSTRLNTEPTRSESGPEAVPPFASGSASLQVTTGADN